MWSGDRSFPVGDKFGALRRVIEGCEVVIGRCFLIEVCGVVMGSSFPQLMNLGHYVG